MERVKYLEWYMNENRNSEIEQANIEVDGESITSLHKSRSHNSRTGASRCSSSATLAQQNFDLLSQHHQSTRRIDDIELRLNELENCTLLTGSAARVAYDVKIQQAKDGFINKYKEQDKALAKMQEALQRKYGDFSIQDDADANNIEGHNTQHQGSRCSSPASLSSIHISTSNDQPNVQLQSFHHTQHNHHYETEEKRNNHSNHNSPHSLTITKTVKWEGVKMNERKLLEKIKEQDKVIVTTINLTHSCSFYVWNAVFGIPECCTLLSIV